MERKKGKKESKKESNLTNTSPPSQAMAAVLRGLAASPLARRMMVEAGVLDALSRAAQCEDDVEVIIGKGKKGGGGGGGGGG